MTTTLTCPECHATLRPAKPLPAGKTVKCPKCGAGFVVGGNGPPGRAGKGGPPPVQRQPSGGLPPAAAVRDEDDEEGGTYTVKGEDEKSGPGVDFVPDAGIRDLRGPAMQEVVDPSNKMILVGVTGFIGWVAFLVILVIPLAFPLSTKEDREKKQKARLQEMQMKGDAGKHAPLPPDDDSSFLQIGGLDLRGIGELPWYLIALCFLPVILGGVYSAVVSVGAVKIQSLESRDWGVITCVMAMLPLNAGGLLCVLALVLNLVLDMMFEGVFKWIVLGFLLVVAWGLNLAVGIWMLTILNKPDVIAGFEYVPD
jgi:hypothetical protein